MNIKQFYTKYTKWILICLLVLLSFKSCQSCSRSQTIEYNKIQYISNIDSLNYVIDSLEQCNKKLNDTLHFYESELKGMNRLIDKYEQDNKHYRDANRSLINTNKELSLNKEEEK